MQLVDSREEQVADLDEPDRALVDRLSAAGMDGEAEVGAERPVDEDLAVDELLGEGVDAQDELRLEDRLDERLADPRRDVLLGQSAAARARARLGLPRQAIHREIARVLVEERLRV